MHILQGIAASPGIAVGESLVLDYEGFRIPRHSIARDAVGDELQRLEAAIQFVAADLDRKRLAIAGQLGVQYGEIFAAQAHILSDPQLRGELEQLIRNQHFSPEYAVSRTFRRYAKILQGLGDSHLKERAHDIFDIEHSLLAHLQGRNRQLLGHLTSPVVVLAHNLTPGEVACFDRQLILGFVTEVGGAGGHTAIIAKGLEIPAVVGAGSFLAEVSGGDTVIVDGDQGGIVLRPDEPTLQHYRRIFAVQQTHARHLEELRDLPAETSDGARVRLWANIEFPEEARLCLERGAEGIGLYRTEFLYLTADREPTEDMHYQAYGQVVRTMAPRPVVIRTLDLGADKMGRAPDAPVERNPFLGLRSIRLSLRNVPLFRTQLRAILRASSEGQVSLMFPLISSLEELRQAKLVLAEAMDDLEELGEPFDRQLRVGIMVEVPSVVVLIERFLREVDFVSIGTNDLIQYALAVDRSNEQVADCYQAAHPAVLRLIDTTVRAARAAHVDVSICGQMSGDPLYTPLLLGLGLRTLSVPPVSIPEVKQICRSISIPHCEAIAQRVLDMETRREIDAYLREELRKLVPPPGQPGRAFAVENPAAQPGRKTLHT